MAGGPVPGSRTRPVAVPAQVAVRFLDGCDPAVSAAARGRRPTRPGEGQGQNRRLIHPARKSELR